MQKVVEEVLKKIHSWKKLENKMKVCWRDLQMIPQGEEIDYLIKVQESKG